jgi:hypothetical protein
MTKNRSIDDDSNYINNDSIDDVSTKHIKNFISLTTPMNHEDALALARDISDALNDYDAFQLYLSYAQTYPKEKLVQLLERVLSIPIEKIKKSRAALFTYLVEQYAKDKRDNTWD